MLIKCQQQPFLSFRKFLPQVLADLVHVAAVCVVAYMVPGQRDDFPEWFGALPAAVTLCLAPRRVRELHPEYVVLLRATSLDERFGDPVLPTSGVSHQETIVQHRHAQVINRHRGFVKGGRFNGRCNEPFDFFLGIFLPGIQLVGEVIRQVIFVGLCEHHGRITCC